MQSKDNQKNYPTNGVSCQNCGAVRSSDESRRCDTCGSRKVVFFSWVDLGYLYRAEENQIIFFMTATAAIVIILLVLSVVFILFQFRDLFFINVPSLGS